MGASYLCSEDALLLLLDDLGSTIEEVLPLWFQHPHFLVCYPSEIFLDHFKWYKAKPSSVVSGKVLQTMLYMFLLSRMIHILFEASMWSLHSAFWAHLLYARLPKAEETLLRTTWQYIHLWWIVKIEPYFIPREIVVQQLQYKVGKSANINIVHILCGWLKRGEKSHFGGIWYSNQPLQAHRSRARVLADRRKCMIKNLVDILWAFSILDSNCLNLATFRPIK